LALLLILLQVSVLSKSDTARLVEVEFVWTTVDVFDFEHGYFCATRFVHGSLSGSSSEMYMVSGCNASLPWIGGTSFNVS
jgi:hypothetical protein